MENPEKGIQKMPAAAHCACAGRAGSGSGAGGGGVLLLPFGILLQFVWVLFVGPLKMNRLFGKAKPKAPPPSLTDCIGTVGICGLAIPGLRLSDTPSPGPAHSCSPHPPDSDPRSPHLGAAFQSPSWRHKRGPLP